MEQTAAFNGTTTKDQQAWKTKKGFGPLIVVATLLLGLAFHAGQMRGSSTVAGRTRGGAAADASLMSVDTFESMMLGQDCDPETCCDGQVCDPTLRGNCGPDEGMPCGYYTCNKMTPAVPVYPPVYRCQSNYSF